MSMLTPPGMGGKYRITGDRYPRMRRPRNRRRIAVAVIGAAAAVGMAGWGTLQLIDVFTGGGGKARAAGKAAGCDKPESRPSAQARPLPKPGEITVNVYNATQRTGLAKQTADELKKRGFKIGKVGNAPVAYDKKVKGTGILLGAPNATEGPFKVLGTQLPGTETEADKRTGADVDLIIGDGFKALAEKQAADQALVSLTNPSPAPSASAKC
ncbi:MULTISPECIES: LytR C-terminal domain-containing protein [unclassified Streptomyces]|uniref:LytR C-terminal domain-containing protein n=1 Tax=unclassified Streptomyces TaxID=2593676 RepID=UPI003FD5256A